MALKAIDLFAGGGGLTVGLKRAGFEVVAAVEKDRHAYATYKANHPEVHLLPGDIKEVSADQLRESADFEHIDLLAACPPCQGYTSLNKNGINDPRNKLIFQITRLAESLLPKAIMVENVPGLATKGSHLLEEFKAELRDLGYCLESSSAVLQAADYGVPQHRRRLVILAGLGFEIDLPKATHSKEGLNGYYQWKTVRDAIGDTNNSIGNPITMPKAKERGDPQRSRWHVVRSLSTLNIERLKAAVPGESWASIPEHLRPKCHQGEYKGFSNVYGRMEWSQPAPTITGGCTTFSKGRFGHPEENRTISVREAALLQTFPEDYHFAVPYMEAVCNVIGNALPCDFAEELAKQCYSAISDNCREAIP